MTGVRFVKVRPAVRDVPVPVAVPLELAEAVARDLPEVQSALFQAAQAFRALGQMIGSAPNEDVAALAELCGLGLLHLAEVEGERLDDLAVCVRRGLAFGKPHPDDPATPRAES